MSSCLEGAPGFFPVHSGRLPEVSQLKSPRVVIFGTDWGKQDRAAQCRRKSQAGRPCRCQRFRRTARGEQPYPTEGYLFEVLTEARLDLGQVFLTNAVLGLAKKRQEGNAPMFAGHPKYLRECGEYHRRCLRNVERPALACSWDKRISTSTGAASGRWSGRNSSDRGDMGRHDDVGGCVQEQPNGRHHGRLARSVDVPSIEEALAASVGLGAHRGGPAAVGQNRWGRELGFNLRSYPHLPPVHDIAYSAVLVDGLLSMRAPAPHTERAQPPRLA